MKTQRTHASYGTSSHVSRVLMRRAAAVATASVIALATCGAAAAMGRTDPIPPDHLIARPDQPTDPILPDHLIAGTDRPVDPILPDHLIAGTDRPVDPIPPDHLVGGDGPSSGVARAD